MKTKVFLQLGLTLLLGFVIGFMSHGYVTSQKIKNYTWGRGEAMFWKHALQEIKATPAQFELIMPIVKQYSEKGHKVMSESVKKVEPIWEEMNEEIMPILTKEQQAKLEELRKERTKRFRERVKHSGQQHGGQGQHRQDSPNRRKGMTPPPPEKK